MKKNLFALLVMSAVAAGCASALDLVYGLDFNGVDNNRCTTYVSGSIGETAATVNGGFVNWPEDLTGGNTIDGNGQAVKTNGGVPVIGDGSASLGVSTLTGLTVAINSYNSSSTTSSGTWKDVLGFTLGGKEFKIEYGGTGGNVMKLYRNDGGENPAEVLSVSTSSSTNAIWLSIVLSMTDTTTTMYVYNAAGTLLGSGTAAHEVSGDLTKIVTAAGCFSSHHAAGNVFIDNLAVYNDALTEAQAQAMTLYEVQNGTIAPATALASDPGTGNIPEPATATLSLLALAGLAARRRRK